VLLEPALATGNLEIRTNAMVREVKVDQNMRATGVSYVDRRSLDDVEVRARVVVLAASACESARLLLNSRGPRHENGLANSSGTVGRYLMDSTGSDVMGFIPSLAGMPAHNEDGVGGGHVYVPWWRNRDQSLDFSRGYHIEVWGGRGMPGYGFMGGIERFNGKQNATGSPYARGGGGFGASLKADYRHLYGSTVGFSGRGEMIARYENYCEIDPDVVDRFGIPVLRFNVNWSDQELNQIRHFQETGHELIHAMGGEPLWDIPSREDGYGILAPGRIIHEVGTTRMGDDPSRSVVDRHSRAHDVPNLVVADAGPFVSQADKNPTWTILALAMRASEKIAEDVNRGDL
jgi:choline dehydrogenase-like flavoprotein